MAGGGADHCAGAEFIDKRPVGREERNNRLAMAQAVSFGFRVGEIPVPTRYFAEASSVNFERSVEYGLDVLQLMVRYTLHRAHVWRRRQFSARLEEILAPRHREAILRGTRTW